MGKVAVVGSVNMDLVVRTPHVPKLGETVIGSGFLTAPGGKGANQAIAAARLGGDVRMLARVGSDSFGEALRENLAESGVITDDVLPLADVPSGIAMIVVHEGDNFIVIDPGANHALTPADVQAFRPRLAEADIVLVQLEVPIEVVAETVRVCGETGTPVILNPAPAAELSDTLLAGVSYLTPNEGEAAELAGLGEHGGPGDSKPAAGGSPASGEPAPSIEEIIERLHGKGVPNVCVTLGGDGVAFSGPRGEAPGAGKPSAAGAAGGPAVAAGGPAVAAGGEPGAARQAGAAKPTSIERRPALPVKPVDTTAAGDVFSGALAVALTEGKSFGQAVEFAQRAAAISVTRAGAGPSIPTREEVERS